MRKLINRSRRSKKRLTRKKRKPSMISTKWMNRMRLSKVLRNPATTIHKNSKRNIPNGISGIW